MDKKVDIILLYVDGTDRNWVSLYNKTFPNSQIDNNRYVPDGTLKYLFRCIERNINFINKVHFVVQMESQIPEWLDRSKVNIVYHKDFIPSEYLPTYNSQCITSFLHRIPNLHKYYLNINDDCFPTDTLSFNDFYDDKGLPKIVLHNCTNDGCDFFVCADNTWESISNKLNISNNKTNGLVHLPNHNILPTVTKYAEEVFDLLREEILNNNTTQKRSNKGYVYLNIYYSYIKGLVCKENPLGENFYRINDEKSFIEAVDIIQNKKKKTICINEVSSEYTEKIRDVFENVYSKKSIFEK